MACESTRWYFSKTGADDVLRLSRVVRMGLAVGDWAIERVLHTTQDNYYLPL